ncbi:hypothetical protein ACKLNR_012447 [Fusarium oxysporum f. sp. zingiberi]
MPGAFETSVLIIGYSALRCSVRLERTGLYHTIFRFTHITQVHTAIHDRPAVELLERESIVCLAYSY